MFCSKGKNNQINALHKKALKLITPGIASLDQMLDINKMPNIHTRNIQILLVEVFRCLNKLNPVFLWDEVCANEKYFSKRNGLQLILPKAKKSYGRKTLSYRGSLLWNYLPKNVKILNLPQFKAIIRDLKHTKCYCNLCKSSLH